MILGIDVSSYLEEQRITGQKYKKDRQIIDPFALFKQNGVTHIRTRIWNDPYDDRSHKPYLGGTCDLDNFLNLYNLLKPYGFKYVVDFHYSDFWCDPSKQFLPKAWRNLTIDEVSDALYEYTKNTLLKIKEAGVDVEYIQTGNETTNGMCYPLGELKGGEERKKSFANLAKLLKAGRQAAKEVFPNASVIVHLEKSYDQYLYREYITELLSNGLEIDVLGSSYYPFWHHNINEYLANMDMVQKEFGLKIMNCEFGFPFTLLDYKKEDEEKHHMSVNKSQLSDFKDFLSHDISREGQKLFVRDFLKLAKEHNFIGSFYWEPLWVPGNGICWASEEGQKYQNLVSKDTRNDWANQCLFDYEGNALPALDEFKI